MYMDETIIKLCVLHKLYELHGNYVNGCIISISQIKKVRLRFLHVSPNISFVLISRAALEPKAIWKSSRC